MGVEIGDLPLQSNQSLVDFFSKGGVRSVVLDGGSNLAEPVAAQRLVDQIVIYLALHETVQSPVTESRIIPAIGVFSLLGSPGTRAIYEPWACRQQAMAMENEHRLLDKSAHRRKSKTIWQISNCTFLGSMNDLRRG
jgi:hypothetical protein